MSAITIENDLVHYEVLGRGRPVILLHGWLGSWRYWVPSMQQLSAKYRAYALDLWGFGDSGKEPKRFDFDSQVVLLDQFMEKMGITKAALVGHDLGAAVATRYATLHPDRVPRMLAVSPPLFQMAPANLTVTIPVSSSRQIAAASTPVAGGSVLVSLPSAPGTSLSRDEQAEAETMPWRTEEMRERIRVALDKQAQQMGEAAFEDATKPKPPTEAAQVPTDKPVTEVSTTASPAGAASVVSATSASPATPAPSTAPAATSTPAVTSAPAVTPAPAATPAPATAQPVAAGTVQPVNPLKSHLGMSSRLELLEKHVEAGADRDKLKVELEKAHERVIELGVESFAGVDTLREMLALKIPVVAVSGMNDTFVLPPSDAIQLALKGGSGPFLYIPMDNTRHFPMLENVTDFTRLLLGFLEVADVTTIEIKKLWERRVR